jgi:hypothetical protein
VSEIERTILCLTVQIISIMLLHALIFIIPCTAVPYSFQTRSLGLSIGESWVEELELEAGGVRV